ncbi:MAG: hypothetical protein PHI56_03110 [Victivallaceae bacterium]|nr:hypothetical protein [Victivallaceae bacterium]MDD3703735.1 hypothetical protein [Victivallaceae bacterium]MDD5662816.1 hypothetical protein [Victivallaceae bacterium]
MADEKDMNTAGPGANDPLNKRDTNSGTLKKLGDTRTRKTIKLRPVTASPLIPINSGSEDSRDASSTNTSRLGKMGADTRTRKTIKLNIGGAEDTASEVAAMPSSDEDKSTATVKMVKLSEKQQGSMIPKLEGQEPAATSSRSDETVVLVPDPLNARNTDTGTLKKLDDTRTRKTIKLNVERAQDTAAGANAMPSVEAGKSTATVKIDRLPPKQQGSPNSQTETKASEQASPRSDETVVLVSDPLNVRHTDTVALGKLEDTRTRKTIKLGIGGNKGGLSVTQGGPDSGKPQGPDTQTRKTIKLAPTSGGVKLAVESNAATPSTTSSSSPPQPGAESNTQAEDQDDTRTRKTVKLGSGTVNTSAVKAAAESVMPSVAQAKSVPASRQTVRLRPSEAGSAPSPAAPGSAAKEAIKLKSSPSAAPPAPPASAAPNSPASAAPNSDDEQATSKAPALKAGLTLKKNDTESSTPKGPPRAAAEEAELKSSAKKKRSDGNPWLYATFCTLLLILVLFSAFLSTAQYFNIWQPELAEKYVGGKIKVPVIDEQIKNR